MTATKERTITWHDKAFVTEPKNHAIVAVYRDFWWMTNDQGQIAIYGKASPQCNMNRELVERLFTHPDATGVEQIPLAFVEIDLRDYQD